MSGGRLMAHEADEIHAESNLSEVLHFGLLHNASIEAAHHRWEATKRRIPQARAWPDPKLTWSGFARSVETRVGPQEHRIGFVQPLPWLKHLDASTGVAETGARAVYQEVLAAQLEMVREVKQLWHELGWLEESIRVTEENLQLLKQLEAVAQTRFKTGGDLGAVTKAQVELGRVQDQLASLMDRRTPLKARMNAWLGREADALLPAPTLSHALPGLPEEEHLFERQRASHPVLQSIAMRMEREDHREEEARLKGLPQFGIGFDYIVTGEARTPGVRDSGKDAAMAMVSVSLPLWRGKYRAMREEVAMERERLGAERRNAQLMLQARLRTALYEYRDAGRKAGLYGQSLLPQARSSLNVARRSYESGKGDFLDLIDAQRVLLNFELEERRAIANRLKAHADIEMLAGGLGQSAVGTTTQEIQP